MNEPLRKTLIDAVSFLNDQSLPYALIGGLAVSLRGQPRATADVDIVIATDIERAVALAGSLHQSSFRPLFDDISEIVTSSYLLPLRHRLTNVKVDLAIGISGFEREAVSRAESIPLAGIMVRVARAEELLIMKIFAGRPQDEQDLLGLVIAQGERLDWDNCLQMARELGEAVGQDLTSRVRLLRKSQELDG